MCSMSPERVFGECMSPKVDDHTQEGSTLTVNVSDRVDVAHHVHNAELQVAKEQMLWCRE
jgi:hypothetical protein